MYLVGQFYGCFVHFDLDYTAEKRIWRKRDSILMSKLFQTLFVKGGNALNYHKREMFPHKDKWYHQFSF